MKLTVIIDAQLPDLTEFVLQDFHKNLNTRMQFYSTYSVLKINFWVFL